MCDRNMGRKDQHSQEFRKLCGNSTYTKMLTAITRILCIRRLPITLEQQFRCLSCYMGVHRQQLTSLLEQG